MSLNPATPAAAGMFSSSAESFLSSSVSVAVTAGLVSSGPCSEMLEAAAVESCLTSNSGVV